MKLSKFLLNLLANVIVDIGEWVFSPAFFFPLPSLFLVPLVSSIRSWNSMRRTFYERNFPNENKTSANKMCCKRKTFSLHTFCWAKELWMWTDNTSKLSNVRCCSALWMCFEKARRKEQKCIAWQNSYVYFTSIKCTWIGIGVKFLLIAFYRSEQCSLSTNYCLSQIFMHFWTHVEIALK